MATKRHMRTQNQNRFGTLVLFCGYVLVGVSDVDGFCMASSLPAHGLSPQFEGRNGDPPSSRRSGLLFYRETFSMGAATRNHIEVADLVHFAQVWCNPGAPQGDAPDWIEPEPPTIAERDVVLMVIRGGTLSLIADQQRAVRQFDYRPQTMEAGNNGRELDIRFASKVEIVVPVA